MVDDFRPQQPQQPQEPKDNLDEFREGPDGAPETYVMPTGEPTTLDAAHQGSSLEIPKKKKSGAKKWLLWGMVVLLLAGLGAFAYWQWSEAQDSKSELSSVQQELATVKAAQKQVDEDADKTDSEPVSTTLTPEQSALQAASAYYCGIVDFGCDKVTTKVLASVPHSTDSAGFYVIQATTATKDAKIYLKSVDNLKWAVIYQGGSPMDETTKLKFDVPDSIAKA